jgi:hypothetical protein
MDAELLQLAHVGDRLVAEVSVMTGVQPVFCSDAAVSWSATVITRWSRSRASCATASVTYQVMIEKRGRIGKLVSIISALSERELLSCL